MKKIPLLLLSILILLLSSCSSPFYTDDQSNAARIEELEAKVAEYERKLSQSEENEQLLEEYIDLIENYELQLDAAKNTAAEQSKRISERESEISELKYQLSEAARKMELIKLNTFSIYEPLPDNSAMLICRKQFDGSAYMMIKKQGEDEKELYYGGITYYAVSPDSKMLVLDDYLPEESYTCYAVIDLETHETKFNYMYGLPNGESAAYLEWLDGRYFLFVSHRNVGMNLRGGDVYVYDTETDKYQPLVLLGDQSLQVIDMKTYPDAFVAFRTLKYDETKTHTQEDYYTLTADEIYELIKNNKTVDFSDRAPLK